MRCAAGPTARYQSVSTQPDGKIGQHFCARRGPASVHIRFCSLLGPGHLGLALLLRLDLRLDCLPVHRDLLIQLREPVVGLLLVILLYEALSIGDNCVDMRLLSYSYVEGFVPLVELDVHLDSTIVEAGRHQDVLRLINFLAVEGKSGVSSRFRRQLFDVVNVLHLIGLINDCQRYLKRVQLATVNSHGGQTSPQSLLLDKSAQSDRLLKVRLFHVLIKDTRIG